MQTEQELLQALRRNIDGVAVVTSTVRAARALRQRYSRQQQLAGQLGWRTPQILAWEPWLKTLWDAAIVAGAESRILMNDSQELELWLQVLAQDEAATQTISIEGLAGQAHQAWQAMHRYRIGIRDLRDEDNIDAKAFSRWVVELDKIYRRLQYLPSSQVESALAPLVRARKLALPETIVLVGFDRTTPSQDFLIEALREAGCQVETTDVEAAAGTPASAPVIAFANTLEEELESAAAWIRATLLENPNLRIGVITPSLAALRDGIDAVFRRTLAPSSMEIHAANARLPYEFSLGTPLHRMPAVRTALGIIAWLDRSLSAEEVSWLLVHGDFSSRSGDTRAMLDRKFREREFQLGGPVSLETFREWLTDFDRLPQRSQLRGTFDRIAVAAKRLDLEKPRSYTDWREAIEELLSAAEWNLLKATGSTEYQLLRRWNALLNQLSSLSAVTGAVSLSHAIERLKILASKMLFTLETSNAPVQILGASEAAGLTFDQIWWMNAQAANWPPGGHAQPFLPWSVQRAAHMPYADPVTDAAFAERVTQRVLHSAPAAIISFALQQSDPTTASAHAPSAEIAISPILRNVLPQTPLVAMQEFLSLQFQPTMQLELSIDSKALEIVDNEPAIPFEASQVRSGVAFLKHQAACPFRAFAEIRLAADPMQDAESGLPAKAKGIILHEVLQRFWDEIKSQKALLELTQLDCRQIVRGHIEHALRRFRGHAVEPWQKALLDIEADRIEARLLKWLDVERSRPDFTVLKMEESLNSVQLAGVELRCRIDRIDQVEQGIVLLDYKTGKVDSKACDGERPDEPQLPAYAVLRNDSENTGAPLAGVAFAGLHPRNVELTVVASMMSVFPAASSAKIVARENLAPEELLQKQEEWRTTLTRLAEDFVAGVPVVDPKKRNETCRYCVQSMFCRVREADASVDEESLDDGSASSGDQDFDS